MSEKLQKIMARAGIGSRRHSEELISAGRVTVNGNVATIGDRADGERDEIRVDGKEIERQKAIYVMLHKPRNVLSSTEDELGEGRRTVRDLVDIPGHLFPVGRLDKQSLGLILLTNDGKLAHTLTHPRFEHTKVYRALVKGQPSQETLENWRKGIILDGRQTLPAKVKFVKTKDDHTWLKITMREGRKRQIRRVAAELGHPVRTLIRTRLGPLQLGDLPQGKWRHLTPGEVNDLRRETRRSRKKNQAKKQGGNRQRQRRRRN